MANTIFYSWQSDSPNSTNRNFIQDALERAIDAVVDEDFTLDLALDRDTQNVSGAPNVAATILEKINQASVFVADVSIINPWDRGEKNPFEGDKDKRLTSNPNVLFELGYAVDKLGWESIILVHNKATGEIEELPFDIRAHRPLTYTARRDESDRSVEKRDLQRALQRAIIASIDAQRLRQPLVRLFFDPGRERFGVENRGLTPISVSRFVYELPQTAHVNSSPLAHRPIVYVESADVINGVPHWRWVLAQPRSGTGDWELPEFIPSGESEIIEYPPAYIKGDAPRDARVTLKLYFNSGEVIKKTPTIEELFDPNGEYAPPHHP
jgi:predicted nucleotide-binding protein